MNKDLMDFGAILFDMDGVIIDTKHQVETFWFEKMKEHGVHIDNNYVETNLHGRPARFIIEDLFSHLNKTDRLKLEHECIEYDSIPGSFEILPGVEFFLHALLNTGVKFGLVTSALPSKVSRMLKSLSLPNPFKEIVTANEVKKGKPDPECYLLGAEKLGVNISSILVFEDSVSGIQAANHAGATVIGVNKPEIAPMLLDAGACYTIQNFSEIGLGDDTSTFQFAKTGKKFSIHSL